MKVLRLVIALIGLALSETAQIVGGVGSDGDWSAPTVFLIALSGLAYVIYWFWVQTKVGTLLVGLVLIGVPAYFYGYTFFFMPPRDTSFALVLTPFINASISVAGIGGDVLVRYLHRTEGESA